MVSSARESAPPTNRLHEALRAGGRRMDWLARKTGYSVGHVSRVANGHLEPSGVFKRLSTQALDLPESYLFPRDSANGKAA